MEELMRVIHNFQALENRDICLQDYGKESYLTNSEQRKTIDDVVFLDGAIFIGLGD